jgi:hypothetical protein
MGWQLHMEMIGARRKALDHKVQEPRETDANGTTDASQRDTFAEQVFNHGASLVRNGEIFGTVTKLALARFTQMILFAMASMAIFLDSLGIFIFCD